MPNKQRATNDDGSSKNYQAAFSFFLRLPTNYADSLWIGTN